MSYELSTNRLIAVLESVPASELVQKGRRSRKFLHVPEFDPEDEDTWPERDRSFSLLSSQFATDSRTTGESYRGNFVDLQLTVAYSETTDARQLDLLQHKDYALIRAYLLNQQLWQPASSGIVQVTVGLLTNVEGLPARRVRVGKGRYLLEVDLALRYQNNVS